MTPATLASSTAPAVPAHLHKSVPTPAARAIFTNWIEPTRDLFGRHPVCLTHRLDKLALFSRDSLVDLIETYPKDRYALVHMGSQKDRRLWREGETGGISGAAVFRAIECGRMWLNLRDVSTVDRRFKDLLDEIFEELAIRIPGFDAPRRTCGILISSPNAQVYYHADLPGQALWQIEGRKRVFVYPSAPPFITPDQLEDIALFDMELDVPYAPWYDDHARCFEIGPGEMLTWPLNAPHRVENLDCLNVSMTISYTTEEIRRLQMVNLANGLLRHRFAVTGTGRAITGLRFFAKAALQKTLRGSRWVRQERAARRAITFRLDPERPGQVIDLAREAGA
jgi:hypothetical protein